MQGLKEDLNANIRDADKLEHELTKLWITVRNQEPYDEGVDNMVWKRLQLARERRTQLDTSVKKDLENIKSNVAYVMGGCGISTVR